MRDDEAIIRAISSGDEDALLELMDRYREPVFRLAYRYVGNRVDAANLAEEVFQKIYFNADKYRPRSSARSWLFTIAANQCRDFLRREKRQRHSVSLSVAPAGQEEAPPLSEQIAGPDRDAASATQSSELMEAARKAIRELPAKLRFPFVFCVLEGHSQDTAAEVLRTSRKTVESRIYRARKELQAALEDRF